MGTARTALVVTVALLIPSSSRAQAPLSELLVRLAAQPLPLLPVAGSHDDHFVPGTGAVSAPFIINQQLVSQLTTGTIPSPAGGFTYSFDPSAGVFTRASTSFGPAYADRALTNGRGKLTVGASFHRVSYTSFEGQDLSGGDVKVYLTHRPVTGGPTDADLVETSVDMKVSNATTTAFANYGLTDRWDIAVAIPIVRVSLDATLTARLMRGSSGPTADLHRFGGSDPDTASTSSSGSATGLGDVLLRTKYRLLTRAGGGIAAAFDVHLPTGDEADLLGAGALRTTVTGIASSSHGAISPHLNLSYTFGGRADSIFLGDIEDELGYRAGVEYAVSPTVTLSGTLVGRHQFDTGRLELVDVPWSHTDATGSPVTTTLQDYRFRSGSLHGASLAIGAKANVTRTLVLSGTLLVGLTSAGATARLTPALSLDYTF